jgi:hypothetical protein
VHFTRWDASLRWHDGSTHILSSVGRLRSQIETNIRVTVTAVKTEVAIPIIMTTAKPFTGPEPK